MFQNCGQKFRACVIGGLVTAAFLVATASTLTAQTNFEVLHLFNKPGDAQEPTAGVQVDKSGNLFGSAEFGGENSFGCDFHVETSGFWAVQLDGVRYIFVRRW
jgi:hypothetical protein